MLVELVNSGITISQTISKGRQGYGSQFRLTVDPNLIGISCFPERWKRIVNAKAAHDVMQKSQNMSSHGKRNSSLSNLCDILDFNAEKNWNDYVGK